jgi:hypothetical protein
MADLYVIATTATAISMKTFGSTSTEVARVVGAQDDPDSVGAPDAIKNVLQSLNGRRWDYLTVRGSDITIYDHTSRTAGQEGYQGAYTIPTPFRDLISAQLKTSADDTGGTPLMFVNRSDWDRTRGGTTSSGTGWISFFQLGTTNKVELLAWPTTAGFLEFRYFRPIEIPSSSEQRLDLPADSPLESCVVHMAKEIVAANKGEMRKARYFGDLGRMALSEALRADVWKSEDDTEWKMPWEWAAGRQNPKLYEGYGTFGSEWRR